MGDETAVPLPPYEVTGTHLGRPANDGPIPVITISRNEIEQSGDVSLSDLLRDLPEFPVANINEAVAISSTHGVVAPELRDLGAGNTLVLVDGRRTTVSANALDTNVFVDLNRFPPALLERIEILKGGASAIYGADAVAGVINLITRRQPEGGEVSLSYGNAFDTDAAEFNSSVAWGVTRGRLGLSIAANYMFRHGLANRDRSFSRTANLVPEFAARFAEVAGLPPARLAGYDGRSLVAPNAMIQLVSGQTNGLNGVNISGLAPGAPVTALPGTGGQAAGTLTAATPSYTEPYRGATGGSFNAAAAAGFVAPELTRGDPNARNLFNFNDYTWLVPEAQRAGANVRLDYTTRRGTVIYGDGSVQHNRSHTEFMPPGVVGMLVPRTNPYNPFGVDVTATWRIVDGGARKSQLVDDTQSAMIGARSATGAALQWDSAVSYSRNAFTDTIANAMSAARVAAALARTDPAAALNPFGGETYRNDPNLIDSLKIKTWTAGCADLLTFDATLTGRVAQWAAGPILATAYLEHRHERFNATSDAASQAGDPLGQGSTGPDSHWARDVTAVAAETRVPLVAGRNGHPTDPPRLALEAAARSEIFAGSFRSGVRPTVGIIGHPLAGVVIRVSAAWTFRAPTLLQLYAPQSEGYANSVPDPRRPAALTGDQWDGPNVSRLIRMGGNPDLQPEKGRVLQADLEWAPPFLRGFSAEATFFRYKIENIINSVSADYVLQNELGGLGALVHRNPGTETYVNRTSAPIPVLTGPDGQTTLIAPGETATVPGRLQRVDIYTTNLSRRRMVGWDFGVHQTLNLGNLGRLAADAAATYTVEMSDAFDRYSPLIDRTGTPGVLRWRGRFALDWDRRRWAAGASLIYTPSTGRHAALNYLGPYRVVGVHATWTSPKDSWMLGSSISVGIDDLFNASVPLAADPPMGYWASGVARPQGRFWRVTLRHQW